MNIEELKEITSKKLGIKKEIITGETPEDIIMQAKVLLDYKHDNNPEITKKSTAEQFKEWMQGITNEEKYKREILEDIAQAAGLDLDNLTIEESNNNKNQAKLFANWMSINNSDRRSKQV